MNDRELLELAARADGRVLKWKLGFHQTTLPPSVPYFEVGGLVQYWDPLKDDGDALRLAHALGMQLNLDECNDMNDVRTDIVMAAAAIGAAL